LRHSGFRGFPLVPWVISSAKWECCGRRTCEKFCGETVFRKPRRVSGFQVFGDSSEISRPQTAVGFRSSPKSGALFQLTESDRSGHQPENVLCPVLRSGTMFSRGKEPVRLTPGEVQNVYPWHDTFHMGIVHFMAYPWATTQGEVVQSVEEILADEFFQAIEVSALLDGEVLQAVGALCDVARVEVLLGAQPLVLSKGLSLGALEEEERKQALEALKQAVDKAYVAKAKALAFLSGKRPEEGREEEARKRLVESLVELCRYAEKRAEVSGYLLGVNLEVFDYAVDKRALIGPAPFAFEVASLVRAECPNFGLTIDLSHEPLLFEDPACTLTLLAPWRLLPGEQRPLSPSSRPAPLQGCSPSLERVAL